MPEENANSDNRLTQPPIAACGGNYRHRFCPADEREYNPDPSLFS